MDDISFCSSCGGSLTETSLTSWEKTLDVLKKMTVVFETEKVVAFGIQVMAPGKRSAAQEYMAVASELGIGISTVEGWDKGTSGVGKPALLIHAVAGRFDSPDAVARAFEDFCRKDGVRRGDLFPWLIGGAE